jgi:hypothetical protein
LVVRWAEIESDDYVVVCGGGETNEAAMDAIEKMNIDRDERVVKFTLADGSEVVASFVPREKEEWPAGCPTNIGSTHMEVLDIEKDTLTIDPVTLNNPILVRNCPQEPVRVVLREDGELGGSGGACTPPAECIFFGPGQDSPWTVNSSTASTSEDTPVNIEIITSPIEVSGDLDLGTFTVISGAGNGSVINNYDWTVTYTPEAGFNGTDAFKYRVCDIYGYWDTATVTLSVNAEYALENRNFSH